MVSPLNAQQGRVVESDSAGAEETSIPVVARIAVPTALSLLMCNICRICMSIAVLKAGVEFGWSDTLTGLIQSSFLWGYMATQLVGGVVADAYGGKVIMAVSVAWFSVATFFTPLAAGFGVTALLLTRCLVGLGMGAALPCMNNLVGSKVPGGMRATVLGLSFGGFHSGNILGLLISPFLVASFGWRSLFYAYGIMGIPVLMFWLSTVPRASPRETQGKAMPIGFLLSQAPTWAIFVANFVNHWGYFIYLSWLPTYFSREFGLNVASSSIFSLLPWLVMAVCSSLSGVLADRLVNEGVRVRTVRRALQCTSFVGTGASLLLIISPIASNVATVVPLFMLALGLKALGQAGFVANMSDVAPTSAGKLFGLSNTVGSFAGILSVSISGYVLEKTGSFRLIFLITAGMYLAASVVYFFLCNDEEYKYVNKAKGID